MGRSCGTDPGPHSRDDLIRRLAYRIQKLVYTRKSHEEGLDQEFNSLDAQRQAGEIHI